MDAFDKSVLGAAAGCIIALALWKGTRESLGLSLAGLFLLALASAYTDRVGQPWGYLLFGIAFAIVTMGGKAIADVWHKRKTAPKTSVESPKEEPRIQVVSK
jgi:hypothetical protein